MALFINRNEQLHVAYITANSLLELDKELHDWSRAAGHYTILNS